MTRLEWILMGVCVLEAIAIGWSLWYIRYQDSVLTVVFRALSNRTTAKRDDWR